MRNSSGPATAQFFGSRDTCHGSRKQESNYRLDVKTIAFKGGDLGEQSIIVGKSTKSPLIAYVAGLDPDIVMPPEGKNLSANEVGILRAWIDQGATWPKELDGSELKKLTTDHWSFRPLIRPALPKTISNKWVRNPVDAFILAKLKLASLTPSPLANRVDLIRRLYLDLHGLLPTVDQVQRHLDDNRPDATDQLVDRLLASPQHGERWARHWLDVVRFAETDGFEMNQERPGAYHYRDYVIQSLNEDKPYNQFVFEQLAGDAVNADAATGFLVGGAYDKVKSADINFTLMQRQDELADIVNTTGTAFLGLTLGCARCHNHKFDPVLQKDYYSLQAVFAGVKHGAKPLKRQNDEERVRKLNELASEISDIKSELEKLGIARSINSRQNDERIPPTIARFVRFTILATNSKTEPCLDELEIWSTTTGSQQARNVALKSAGAKISSSGNFAGSEYHQLKHINDGQYGNRRSWISNERGKGWVQIELLKPTSINRIVWGRDKKGIYTDRLATNYHIEVAIEPGKWSVVANSTHRPPRTAGSESKTSPATSLAGPQLALAKKVFRRLKVLEAQQKKLTATPVETIYTGTFVQPGPTHRLYRGDPTQKREEVSPDALMVLGTLGLDSVAPEQKRRIALARWMTSENNPLTARVMVNRIWHYHFGTGLVDTPSDFGANGTLPSHPQLLDWLAHEFIRSGWSVKHIHRLIVTSNVYQQSSRPRRNALAIDANSRLLWRFPPHRLEAEAIRDIVLQLSGVLDLKMGGPGFSSFMPNYNYVRVYTPKEKFGPAEWRRMIYMTKVRMEQDAIFGIFDCPDAGQVAPKRSRSTTSIQALNLLNSGFMIQQAERFATRLQQESGDQPTSQVQRAFQLAFGRSPQTVEVTSAVRLIESHGLATFCRAILNANELLFLP